MIRNETSSMSSREFALYQYGKEIFQYFMVTIAVTYGIAFLISKPLEWTIFLLIFAALRSFAGGYHASTKARCLFFSIVLEIAVLSAIAFTPVSFYTSLTCSLLLFALILGIGIMSPIVAPNKPLSKTVYTRCRNVTYVLLAIFFVGFILLQHFCPIPLLMAPLFYALTAVCALGILALLKAHLATAR